MPTTRPRYQITDTEAVRAWLDRAAESWPELANDRKSLLLRLAQLGAAHLPAPAGPSLDAQLRKHAGDWVAVRGDRLLVSGADAEEVAAWLRRHRERAEQLFRVPLEAQDVATEHGVG
jgi:hypothetical protein